MSIDWSAVALGQTIFLAVALAAGLLGSMALSIASALGGNRRNGGDAGGPSEYFLWVGILPGSVYIGGTLLFWSLRVGWALHQGTLLVGSAG